jgi:hypothetical protein
MPETKEREKKLNFNKYSTETEKREKNSIE